MKLVRIAVIGLVACLVACGDSGGNGGGKAGGVVTTPTPRPDFGGVRNAACAADSRSMPGAPPAGETRTGLSCRVAIPSPLNPAEEIVFQVFEPAMLTGGQFYPLVLEGHGFSASRQTRSDQPGIPGLSAPIGALRAAGYGIISIDQAGHGETGGLIRIMDPDQEGRFLLAILDWLEANLDWYAVGPDLDAGRDNMLLGAIGPSYGGGYQLLIQSIDPKKRLDALVPQITWNDLTYSLNPGGVIKSLWVPALFTLGQQAGGGGKFDPFVTSTLQRGLQTNRIDQEGQDFFRYHGLDYFCDGQAVATNGGAGTSPDFAPTAPTGVHALFFQGQRDVLFNYTEAWRNYECLRTKGGDVRLFSYQGGHNSIPVVPDATGDANEPAGKGDFNCGAINSDTATVAWFDQYLKGVPGAANAVLGAEPVCISLAPGDAVKLPKVTANEEGQRFTVPATMTVAGAAAAPVPVSLYTAAAAREVLGGVPKVSLTLSAVVPQAVTAPDDVIVFVATGRTRNGIWEIADNQVQPLRGLKTHVLEMPGIGERLAAGDQVGLLIYGLQEQFAATGGINAASPVVAAVSIQGEMWLPLLGVLP